MFPGLSRKRWAEASNQMTKKISAQLSLGKKWIDIRSVVNPDPDSVGYEIICFVLAWRQKNIYISKFHLWFFAAIVQKKTVEYSFKAIAVGWFFILIEYNPFSYNFGSRIFFSWIRNVFLDPKFFPGSGTLENTELYSDPDPEKNYFGSLPVGDAEDIIPTILQAELVQSEYL